MNHTRQAIRRIAAPWALIGWVILGGLSMCADHYATNPPQTQEQQR